MDGENQPATAHISVMDTLLDHAQDEEMPLVEWALTPMGHCWPKEQYASIIVSIIHLDILCFVTGDPLLWLPKHTKSCSDCLNGAKHSIYILNALSGQSRWSCLRRRKCQESYHLRSEQSREHFGYVAMSWFQDDLRIVRPEFEARRAV